MKTKKTPNSHLLLSITAIACEYTFLILSPQMFETCQNAFWLYLVGHFILNCIFSANDYLVEIILSDEELELNTIPIWRIWLAIAIAVIGLLGLIYVLFKNPLVIVIELLFEVMEQGVSSHRRRVKSTHADQ